MSTCTHQSVDKFLPIESTTNASLWKSIIFNRKTKLFKFYTISDHLNFVKVDNNFHQWGSMELLFSHKLSGVATWLMNIKIFSLWMRVTKNGWSTLNSGHLNPHSCTNVTSASVAPSSSTYIRKENITWSSRLAIKIWVLNDTYITQ